MRTSPPAFINNPYGLFLPFPSAPQGYGRAIVGTIQRSSPPQPIKAKAITAIEILFMSVSPLICYIKALYKAFCQK